MMLLPLQDLFHFPLDRVCLVVDNARSPLRSLSMERKRRSRPISQRSSSWASGDVQASRWSSIPEMKEDHHSGQQEGDTKKSIQRTKSFDGISLFQNHSRSSRWSSTAKPPERFPRGGHRRGVQRSKSSDATSSLSSGLILRRPVRQPSSEDVVNEAMTTSPASPIQQQTKSKFDSYKSPLRIPIRQASRSLIHTSEDSKKELSALVTSKITSLPILQKSQACPNSRGNGPLQLPIRQLSRSLLYAGGDPEE